METLEEAFDRVEEFCEALHINKEQHYKLKLITEELVVNILKHTKVKKYRLRIEMKDEALHVEVCYKDTSFNPTHFSKENKEVEKMSFGGLGLFLVNSLSKSVEYEYVEGENIVKIIL